MRLPVFFAIFGSLVAQQPNWTSQARLMFADMGGGIHVGITDQPGPWSYQVPLGEVSDQIVIGGQSGLPWGLCFTYANPAVGYATTPWGIVDIDAGQIVHVIGDTFPGHATGCAPPFYCPLTTANFVVSYTGIPFSFSCQGWVATPQTPSGYTLTAALHIWQ